MRVSCVSSYTTQIYTEAIQEEGVSVSTSVTSVKNTLIRRIVKEVEVGMLARIKIGTKPKTSHIVNVTYVFSNGVVECCGLGKETPFYIRGKGIVETVEAESILSQFHGTNTLLWWNPRTAMYSFSSPMKDDSGKLVKNTYFRKLLAVNHNRQKLYALEEYSVACTSQLADLLLVERQPLSRVCYKNISSLPTEYSHGDFKILNFVNKAVDSIETDLECSYFTL